MVPLLHSLPDPTAEPSAHVWIVNAPWAGDFFWWIEGKCKGHAGICWAFRFFSTKYQVSTPTVGVKKSRSAAPWEPKFHRWIRATFPPKLSLAWNGTPWPSPRTLGKIIKNRFCGKQRLSKVFKKKYRFHMNQWINWRGSSNHWKSQGRTFKLREGIFHHWILEGFFKNYYWSGKKVKPIGLYIGLLDKQIPFSSDLSRNFRFAENPASARFAS